MAHPGSKKRRLLPDRDARLLAMRNLVNQAVTAAACLLFIPPATAADPSLAGHWKLQGDARDHSGKGNHGRNVGVDLAPTAARFDGRKSYVEVPANPSLDLGAGDFTLSLHVETAADLVDTLGDLLTQYDPDTRRGFNLSIKHNTGVTGSQANYRNLHFGIDNAQAGEWTDHGRPGKSIFNHSMAVHNGELYVGTVEGQTNADQGHVYRLDNGKWTDLGAPSKSNGVTAMASYNGHLYVGVSRVLLHYSGLEPTISHHIGGKVFRYEDGQWVDCGQLPGLDGVNGMVVFGGRLYVSGFYQPGLFRHEGGQGWTALGSPGGMRPEALCVYNGAIYATGYDEGAVYRFDGEKWSHTGRLGDSTQVYGMAIHRGKLHAGSWPKATVYRYEGDDHWVSTGRLGEEQEVMGPNVYNGKMYFGSLPLARIFRHDGGGHWTPVGHIDHTPDVKYHRAWSMAVYQGRLFVGTLPSGHVWSFEAGKNATDDHPLRPGWRHIVAMRQGTTLKLYIDETQVATSSTFDPAAYNLSNGRPLRIGFGQHDHFNGRIKNVRIYRRALTEDELGRL